MGDLPYGRRLDIADIVRSHRLQLEANYRLNPRQKRILTDIAQCRTEALGGYLEHCNQCGYEQPVYRSCRNRHCPKCQALAQEQWIEQQRCRMLDMQHFHVVFTLPEQLRALAAFAPRKLYSMLMRQAASTLLEFGQTRLQATLGASLVLHTWTRELAFHPHVHCIVTAGGLALNGKAFTFSTRSYLFPVQALAQVFRAKFLAQLRKHYDEGSFAGFDDFHDPEGFQRLINRLPRAWNVYSKPSFDSGDNVLKYLGRYTHRVAISNSRLLDIAADSVTFRTKGEHTKKLSGVEFLRRLLLHVLPIGFHKIRHVGLNGSAPKRELARELLQQPPPAAPALRSAEQWLQLLMNRDVCRCPKCNAPLRRFTIARPRAPPATPTPMAA